MSGIGVLPGVLTGLGVSFALYWGISMNRAFGGVVPIDQNPKWKAKTAEKANGQWEREAGPPVFMNPFDNKIPGYVKSLEELQNL